MRGLAEIVRLRTADCRQAAVLLPSVAAGEPGIDERLAEHVTTCLCCQAEVAAYRRILRHLRALRQEEVETPPGAMAAVLDALAAVGADGTPGGLRRAVRMAYVGAITVATAAAGAAGILMWINRRRPGLAEAG
jgi:hypothetical protein